jgi:GT2 family glycosyltransferase
VRGGRFLVTASAGAGQPLSIVVATRDRPHMLAGCLDALASSVGPADEVIVVDSCSRGADTAAVARAHAVRSLRCDRPGASLARNTGWRAASHATVAFVDDDVRVDARWAGGVRAAVRAYPDAAFFTGRLVVAPAETGAERPVAIFDVPETFVIERSMLVDFGHGANLAARRSALEAVGGYDEAFGPGARWRAAEDLDLVDRLLAAGMTGRYVPDAEASHMQWRRRPDFVKLEWGYGIGQGARLGRLRKTDPHRFRRLSRIVWREQGTAQLAGLVRARYEFGALLAVTRLAGTAFGMAGFVLAGAR